LTLELVVVLLEELDSPRSWASDSLLALVLKLDRSEPIELVLIPLLLYAPAARGSGVEV
jgi:hypothetical protein